MLPKIIVPLYTDDRKYRMVQSAWNEYFRQNVEEYPLILLNKNWKIKPSIIIDTEELQVLTYRYHSRGEDKLTLFSSQSPNGNILNT